MADALYQKLSELKIIYFCWFLIIEYIDVWFDERREWMLIDVVMVSQCVDSIVVIPPLSMTRSIYISGYDLN